MPRCKRLKFHEYVADLVSAGTEVLCNDLKMQNGDARTTMINVARAVCFRNAKSTVYIPDAANLRNLERNAQIWSLYQEDNADPRGARKYTPQRALELAAQFDLTQQMIYRILRGAREAEIAERQGELPGLEPAA